MRARRSTERAGSNRILRHAASSRGRFHMSSSIKSIGAVALLFAMVLTAHAFVPQGQPTTPQNPVTREPVGAPIVASGSAGGRGGGSGNPMAAIYTERCAGCHGAGVEGGRAP